MTDPRSFVDFEKALREQQNDAVYELFSRFTERLVRLARGQIALRLQSKEDPQDIVQSALRTFCLRYAEGQFTVGGWESLWALLAKITTRKCLARSRHYGAGKRDHKLEVPLDAPLDGPESIERELELWSTEPQPEDVIALAETVELLLRSLKKDRDRKILELALEGHTAADIGPLVGRTSRSVNRVLAQVRDLLTKGLD